MTLDSASSNTVTVNYHTTDNTALAGTNYTDEAGQLTFLPAVLTQTVTVPILAAQTSSQPTLDFTLSLSDPSNASLGSQSSTDVAIDYQSATTTTDSASASAVPDGTDFNLSATVSSTDQGTPTGTVEWLDGGVELGTSNLDSTGQTSFTTSALAVGEHSIVAVYQGATNWGSSTAPALDLQVDSTPPVTTASLSGTQGNNNWWTSAVQVSLSANDPNDPSGNPGSGVADTYYEVDGNDPCGFSLYTGPIAVSGDGSHTVYFYSVDNAGNVESTQSFSFVLGKATPTLTIADAGGTYNGSAFPATTLVAGVVPGVDTTPAASLEGVTPTLDYEQLDAYGNVVADLDTNPPTRAGTYQATATFAGSTDYNSASAQVNFTITYGPPLADNAIYSIWHDQLLVLPGEPDSLSLLSPDSDADNDALSIASINGSSANVGQPLTLSSGATLEVAVDGTLIYQPLPGFIGTDQFTYTVSDGIANSNTATVTINVTDQAPVAVDDAYNVLHDQTLTADGSDNLTLLANDTAANGDPLSVASVNGSAANLGQVIALASGASLTVDADGTFVYTPAAGFVGADTFIYTVGDGAETSNTATVTINVTDQAPVAVADVYSVLHDQALTADGSNNPTLLANDAEADPDTLSVASVNGSAANLGQTITLASGALLIVQGDGTFVYTPVAGFVGTDSFFYTDSDGAAESCAANVTINVVNQAPTAVDISYTVLHDQTLDVSGGDHDLLLTNNSDADGDSLSIASVNGSAANMGQTITLASGASLTVQTDGSFVYTAAAGYVGDDTFTYASTDGPATSNTATVTIHVTDKAPVAPNHSYTIRHDQSLTVDGSDNPTLLTNASDADGDPLSVSSVNGSTANVGQQITLASGAEVTVQADGTFTYTVAPGYVGSDTFAYTVADGALASSAAVVTINVTDRPPRVVDMTYPLVHDRALEVDGVTTPSLLTDAEDADGDAMSIASVNGSTANVGQPIELASGASLTVNGDGTLTYTPPAGFTGTDSFTFTASDGALVSNTALATILVTDQAPVADNTAYSILHDSILTADGVANPSLLDNDTDADGDTLQVASIDGIAADVGQTVTLASGASLTVQADGTFVYAPVAGFVGTDSFTYVTTDRLQNSGTATVTIDVTNQAPVASDDAYLTLHDQLLNADGTNLSSLLANDTDADNDTLRIASVNGSAANVGQQITLASGASLTVQTDGTFTYVPLSGYAGTDSFSYTVTDGAAASNSATVTINIASAVVTALADSDTVLHDLTLNVIVDSPDSLLANDIDVFNNPLTVAMVNDSAANVGQSITLGSGALLTVQADGSFQYTPPAGFVGTDQFSYAATDGTNVSSDAVVTINVSAQAITTADASYTMSHDCSLNVDGFNTPSLLASDGDLADLPLSIVAVNGDAANVGQSVVLASGATLTVQADGTFEYTPVAGYLGSDGFTYVAGDGTNTSSPVNVTITVTNQAPVAVDDAYSVLHDQTLVADDSANPSLLNNDTDADNDTLSVASVNGDAANVGQSITLASGGQLTVQSDGTFTYTPGSGFVGVDSFTYTASDGLSSSDSALVSITVTANAITILPASYSTAHDQNLIGDGYAAPTLLAGAVDQESGTLTVAGVNGSAANIGQQITLSSALCSQSSRTARSFIHRRQASLVLIRSPSPRTTARKPPTQPLSPLRSATQPLSQSMTLTACCTTRP